MYMKINIIKFNLLKFENNKIHLEVMKIIFILPMYIKKKKVSMYS